MELVRYYFISLSKTFPYILDQKFIKLVTDGKYSSWINTGILSALPYFAPLSKFSWRSLVIILLFKLDLMLFKESCQ